MITISTTAQEHFVKLLSEQPEGTQIRVFVVSPGTPRAECGVSYCPLDSVEDNDISVPFDAFNALVDSESAPYLEEATIDFVTDKMGAQLTLKAPNAKMLKVDENAPLLQRVQYVLETQINPGLAAHGGQVSIIEITEDGTAIVQFGGGCNGCSMVSVTLSDGIEKELLQAFPDDIKQVKDITEHKSGEHSYY